MNCLLCLEGTESYKNLIVFNSSEWQELNVQYIIEKHLWKLEDLNSQSYICQPCWKELYNFHKFYSKLEKARSNLNDLLNTEEVTKEAIEKGNEKEEAEKISNIAKESQPEPEILFFRDEYPTDIFETEDEEEVSCLNTNSQSNCSEKKSLHDKKIFKNGSGQISNKEQSNTEVNELKSNENLDEIGSKFEEERIVNDKYHENGAEIDSELKIIENNAEDNKMKNGEESVCLNRRTERKCSRRKKSTNDNKIIARKSLRQRSSKDKSKIEIAIKSVKSDKSPDKIDKMLEVERIENNDKENSMQFDENIDGFKNKLELKTTENDAKENKMEHDDQNDDSSRNHDVTSFDAADSGKLHKLSVKDKFIAENVQLICDICKIPQDTFSAVIKHFKEIHNQRGYVKCCRNKFANRFELTDHINFHKNPEDFKCKHCGKVFHKIAALKTHIQEIHEAEVAECDICGKSYTNEKGLKKHKKHHETEDISCEKCGKSYSSKYSLHNHMRLVHVKNIICHLCGRSVILPELKRHMARHEGKKPPRLSCKICDRQFAHKSGLNRHVQDKHPKKEVKSEFKCAECPKMFPAASSLKTHIRQVHESTLVRKCVLCDKTVKGSVALREHMSRHNGEPLYSCGVCSRPFYSNSNLHVHRKTCSGKRKGERVTKRTEN